MASQEVTKQSIIDGYANLISALDDAQRRCSGCHTELRMYVQWSQDGRPENTRLVLECWNCMENTYL